MGYSCSLPVWCCSQMDYKTSRQKQFVLNEELNTKILYINNCQFVSKSLYIGGFSLKLLSPPFSLQQQIIRSLNKKIQQRVPC